MRFVEPKVFLVGETQIIADGFDAYLAEIGASDWSTTNCISEAEELVEAGGRLCYRSWKPGMNVNVTKVREGNDIYLDNILKSKHGSVMEHAQINFILHNVTRVLTHEIVRHRVGCAISQESMRYVRLTDLPFWEPEWAIEDTELHTRNELILLQLEEHQLWMAQHFGLDKESISFDEKKKKTSYMRRFAPDGVATGMLWSANFRTLRHVIEMRSAKHAEEEIRLVFDKIGEIVVKRYPNIFQDFERNQEGEWIPKYSKV